MSRISLDLMSRTTHGGWNALRGIGYAEVGNLRLVPTSSFPHIRRRYQIPAANHKMSCKLSYPFQVRTWGRVGPVFALVALLRHWLSRPGHCYYLLAYGDPSLDLARGSYLPNLRLPVPYIGFCRHKEFLSSELRSPLPTHLRLYHHRRKTRWIHWAMQTS